MADQTYPAIVPGVLLSGVSLSSWPNGGPINLGSGHGPRALVTLHSSTCAACRHYVRGDLASSADRIAEWGGRLAIVVPGQVESAKEFAKTPVDGMQFLTDPQGRVASGKAMVVITDEWGEVYFVADAGLDHDFPTAVDVRDWIRFLAIQCPECEGPEGAWRTI
jgi:hypothetical protein